MSEPVTGSPVGTLEPSGRRAFRRTDYSTADSDLVANLYSRRNLRLFTAS